MSLQIGVISSYTPAEAGFSGRHLCRVVLRSEALSSGPHFILDCAQGDFRPSKSDHMHKTAADTADIRHSAQRGREHAA